MNLLIKWTKKLILKTPIIRVLCWLKSCSQIQFLQFWIPYFGTNLIRFVYLRTLIIKNLCQTSFVIRNLGNYLVNSKLTNAVTMDRGLKIYKKWFHHSLLKSAKCKCKKPTTKHKQTKKELTLREHYGNKGCGVIKRGVRN